MPQKNAAFADLLTELNATDLSGFSAQELETILLYHALGAEVPSSAVGPGVQGTAATQNITLGIVDGEVIITDQGGRTSTVTTVDIQLANGVVHVINTVLVPTL